MNETEFNLIDEPWIRVIDNNCKISEISLKDAILNAHQYKSLCGELPTQDIAVMRLILAVLHTVFSRVDENGDESELDDEDEDEALDRWKALWNKKHFSEKAINDYLNEWHERFWLFHPERPFYQVAGLNIGTDYDAPKLNGEISESNNKVRLFSSYSGKMKNNLSYSQAARWLLYLNAYDDTSSKPTKEGKLAAGGNLPSAGIGWLGKLGLIYLKADNFFETLMMNLMLINNGTVQAFQKPVWEKETVSKSERTEIAVPNNLAELYTLQSRRIFLNKKADEVISYKLLGGDFFQKENTFSEPMTVWRKQQKENEFTPKRHDSSRQMWREFAVLYQEDKNRMSGVVEWYKNYLLGKRLIKDRQLTTAIVSVEYGDKDFFVKNVFADSLTMHAELLSDLGLNWRSSIENEIKSCDEVASAVGKLAKNLYLASGGDDNPKNKHYSELSQNVGAQLFYRLDMPFREWLCSIDPESDNKTDKLNEWQEICKKIVFRYAEELAADTPEQAVTGHFTPSGLMSVPKAMNIFKKKIKEIYGKEGDK